MRRVWRMIGIAAAALAAAPALADLPVDPNICVTPVEAGDAGAPPYAMISSHHRPQFIPGYPTPVFQGDSPADYIDGEGKLRRHPEVGPSFLTDYFRGSDGDVYWWLGSARDDRRFVFDRRLGYFRRVRPDEPERSRQVEAIRAELATAPRPQDAPSHIFCGGIFPTRGRDSGLDWRDAGYMTQRRSAETPVFHLRVETEGDTLRLAWGERSRELTLPSVGYGGWNVTELGKSGAVLFESRFGKQFFLIDAELNLTRPAGDWRLTSPEAIYLPETGEALVMSSAAAL